MTRVYLGDICDFINGGAWSDKEYVEDGIPVLKVTNCKTDSFSLEDIDYLPLSAANTYAQHRLCLHDVVIATVGSHPTLEKSAAGRAVIINDSVQGFYLNQNAVCLRSKSETVLNQRYLGYLARSFEFRNFIQMRGRGAANQMRIAIGSIKQFEFQLPDIHTQRRIADILSAYDDLIENNQKQIKLLEEAAQRLYREWFVELRFPGHETTPVVDGVPEEWKKGHAEDFFNITIGKTPPRSESKWFCKGTEGIPWVSISDMGGIGPCLIHTAEGLTQEAVDKHHVNVCPSGTVLLSFKLTVGRVAITSTPMCTNEAIAHFTIGNEKLRAYAYCYLKEFPYDTLGSTSSISKAVNSKIVKAMPFIMPDAAIINRFSQMCDSLLAKAQMLSLQNERLCEARDRLLPKLMSGEVEV